MVVKATLLCLLFAQIASIFGSENVVLPVPKIEKRALQKSHEKPQGQKWAEAFLGKNVIFDQVPSLVNLINQVAIQYLTDCYTIVLYDALVEESDSLLLQQLFKTYPLEYRHGNIDKQYRLQGEQILQTSNKCINFIIFMADVMRCLDVIGPQPTSKVVVIARSSQWRVHEFLASDVCHSFVNLLVIAKSEKIAPADQELPYILYTHKMYVDGLGSSVPHVVTSWIKNNLTRPYIPLFPQKISDGFAGHRFLVSVGHQPPFVIKESTDENDDVKWDGIEVRLIQLLAKIYNFTTDFREAASVDTLGTTDAVIREIEQNKTNIGLSALYITSDKLDRVDMSNSHLQDCAAFVSLTSTALPRYRAIMGPFHWSVWVALTCVYLLAIFPLAFSDKHTLSNLIESPEEMENMFWYVFGTFTNCFSFSGKKSWNYSTKLTTRLLIGFYWIFTIIVTACYTGSIIAFVTLPIYPATTDTIDQLLDGRYGIGTLDKGGWQYWYQNLSDSKATKLLKKAEFLPNIESGLKNVTKAFFWPYAFLASRAQLDFIIRTNFTTTNKRSLLHISSDCFANYGVSMAFAKDAVYKSVIDTGISRAVQSGFLIKLTHDIEWNMMRSATGKLLQANSGSSLKSLTVEDRALTLDDTQGMFLLLGAGFLMGAASLLSEWLGGCFNFCKRKGILRRKSIASNPRSHTSPTPREKINSVQYDGSIISNYLKNFINTERHQLNSQNNIVECIVHQNGDNDISSDNPSIDYDSEIDRMFNIDELFGEKNADSCEQNNEQLNDFVKEPNVNCLHE